jgi:hypothetical protein
MNKRLEEVSLKFDLSGLFYESMQIDTVSDKIVTTPYDTFHWLPAGDGTSYW